jgi:hypothetical protein
MLNLLQLNEKNKRQVRRAETFLASAFCSGFFLLLRQPLLMRLELCGRWEEFFIKGLAAFAKKNGSRKCIFSVKMS